MAFRSWVFWLSTLAPLVLLAVLAALAAAPVIDEGDNGPAVVEEAEDRDLSTIGFLIAWGGFMVGSVALIVFGRFDEAFRSVLIAGSPARAIYYGKLITGSMALVVFSAGLFGFALMRVGTAWLSWSTAMESRA